MCSEYTPPFRVTFGAKAKPPIAMPIIGINMNFLNAGDVVGDNFRWAFTWIAEGGVKFIYTVPFALGAFACGYISVGGVVRASALGVASVRGAAGAGGAVDVEALLAIAAEFPRPGEGAADGLGSPLSFLQAPPALAWRQVPILKKEKAFGVVGATHVEGGYPPTAAAIWADMLALAPPTLGGVGVGVVSP
eukprot:scaffold8905_cov105-Isochrysis_galbana.AAC.4